jgi:hypothetical protein
MTVMAVTEALVFAPIVFGVCLMIPIERLPDLYRALRGS